MFKVKIEFCLFSLLFKLVIELFIVKDVETVEVLKQEILLNELLVKVLFWVSFLTSLSSVGILEFL